MSEPVLGKIASAFQGMKGLFTRKRNPLPPSVLQPKAPMTQYEMIRREIEADVRKAHSKAKSEYQSKPKTHRPCKKRDWSRWTTPGCDPLPHPKTNVINFLRREQQTAQFEARAGSIIQIDFKPTVTAKKMTTFVGILIELHRTGARTILLRSVIKGIGLEQRFYLDSPLIDSIKVLKHNNVNKAKAYFLRDAPEKFIKSLQGTEEATIKAQ